jgi:integrase
MLPQKEDSAMNLTAKTVAVLALAATETDKIYFDDEQKGFGYRLRRTSADPAVVNKSWIAQYRVGHRSRRVLIGNGATVSAAEARGAARKILAAAALGTDPQGERDERRGRDRHTFASVVSDYLAAKKPQVRVKTFREISRYLTAASYFRPMHNTPIDVVTRKDIASCLARIRRECGETTAVRAKAAVSAFYSWALRMGFTDSNPTIGAGDVANPESRSRVLSDAELAAIWRASRDDDFGRIIKLLILTGCRRQEVGGMKWAELDRERDTWVIPAERVKNARSHALALPPAAWAIIDSVPRRVTRDYLFGARSALGFVQWHIGKSSLDARIKGVVSDWNIHDIRRTVATRMADIGILPHVIEQVLNHQSGHKSGIAGIYNRSPYAREVKAALLLWSDFMVALAEDSERKIVAFPAVAS